MTIFFPTRIKPTGGSSSFARKLQRGLQAKGHQVVFRFSRKFDLLLVNAKCPLRYLLYAKLTRKPIVLRLDGVYYPTSIAGKKYLLYNLPLQIILHFFTDFIIYQSKYSKRSCDKFLGRNRFKPHRVIYNGVDTDLFNNHGSTADLRDFPDQTILITASRFRRPDQIVPLIDGFKVYVQKYNSQAKLVVIGNFENKVAHLPQQYNNDQSIIFLGPIPNNQLPRYLRAADAFLFTHLNPPCPNNIIEAMACGLPICGVADGAMTELTQPHQNSELLSVNNDGFYRPRPFDTNAFAANLAKILSQQPQYSHNARQNISQHFTLRQMIQSYLKAFQECLPKPS